MSWLNLNQSLNNLKGQITNFASEVLSESVVQDPEGSPSGADSSVRELEEKCRNQELEIAALKKLTDELETSLQSERLSRKNGVKDDESNWYWDPAPQTSKTINHEIENQYKNQIRALQDELSNLKERDTIDLRPDTEEELNRLREENKNLTNNLEDLDNQHQLAMERLLTLKKELQKNFEVLKQEHEDLKNTNDDYAMQIKNLVDKMKEKDEIELETKKTMKSDFNTLLYKYQNLERVHTLLRENAEKFQEENQDLHEEVFKLQEQLTKLEHELEITAKHAESSDTVPRAKYEELLKEINELKDRRNANQFILDEINIDDNAKSVIENLKREISELKHELTQKGNEDNTDKFIKTEKVMQLYNKYVHFELPIDYVGEIPSPGDGSVIYKLETAFKTLQNFKKEIMSLRKSVLEKQHNINDLQSQLDDLTTENDFLTSDMQQFEKQYAEMKKNNDFLISEIAALKNASKLEPIIETHEDNLAKLETELADCNRINKTFESEIKKIEQELAEVRTEKIALQESLNDLKAKYTTMMEELEICKTQTNAVEEMENNTNTQNIEKLKMALDEIDELKKRLNNANTKNEQLSIDMHIIENDKVLLTKEVDDLKHSLQEQSSAHKDLENIKLALEHKLQELETKLDQLIKHKSTIENDKFKLEEKVINLQSELSAKSNKTETNIELEKTIAEKKQLSETLNQYLKENSTLQETIENLKIEVSNLKRQETDLVNKNNSLNNNTGTEVHDTTLLKQTVEDLKTKVIQQEILNNELDNLKEENQKLLSRKSQLEAELSSTDNKIVHLEEEFKKLINDLHDKDAIIDALNSTISQNNDKLSNLNQKIFDLENVARNKTQQIESLTLSFTEISEKLNVANEKLNISNEELNTLHKENEEIGKQIASLNDEINSKNMEITALKNQLEPLEKSCTEYKTSIDIKDAKIKELNQSIAELTDKTKQTIDDTKQNEEYARLIREKEVIEKNVIELNNNLTTREQELTELSAKFVQLEKACLDYKLMLDNITIEKTDLINLVNVKHNESIQYHNEIQRLNQVILEQTNEFRKVIDEKDRLLQNNSNNCSNCELIKVTLKEKDEIIMKLNQNIIDYDTVNTELLNARENVINLTEKCNNLDKSLAIQLETVKKLTAENLQLSEQEQNSMRELERLRHHLVEMEENYTQELMTSEQKLTECQTRLHQVEERAKQNSTVYTSNSIRANQEVETLRNQIKLLEKQREEVQARLSDAEDAKSRSEAALINLQVVLEQFQLDKERDIQAATEKIRNKMEDLKRQNNGLQDEIARLNTKLEESLAGLQAASRLGGQVETKTAQINDLKEQVRTLQTSVAAAEERYYNAVSNQQDKVDKNLVKNLVINYALTATNNNHNRTQVLRILSTVLDFNQQECERLGLVKSATAVDSLAAEFVKFLQNESRPRAPLPNMMGLTQSSSRSTTPTSRKSSTLGPQPNPFEAGHKRNPSTGSNNLLFQNMEGLETSSQVSVESEGRGATRLREETGVNQTRNNEGAILKHVLRDM